MDVKPIRTEDEYRAALARIEELQAKPELTVNEDAELECWANYVESYEEKR